MSATTLARDWARNPAYAVFERFPRLWCTYIRRRTPGGYLVSARTDIVLDGFQGSASTFARHALLASNPGVSVASHLHNPAHLVAGIRLGLPTVLLVREPVDAAASWLAREPVHRPARVLERWAWFHRRLLPYLDRLVVAPFDRVVHAFGDVVTDVNRRFDRSFIPFPHEDPDAIAAIQRGFFDYTARTRGHERADLLTPAPSPVRDQAQMAMRHGLVRPELAAIRSECERLYGQVLEAGAAVGRVA